VLFRSNIIGAVKLTGKTSGKTTFGLLDAFTAQETALAESLYVDAASGQELSLQRRLVTEPRANFLVGRIKQDLWKGNSHVGAIVTAVNRQNAASAYTGGLDWSLKWRASTYEFRGQVAGNHTETDDGVETGWATQLRLSRESGWLEARVEAEAISGGFEINDLGFQWRNDYYNTFQKVEFKRNNPWWKFQRNDVELEQWALWNMDSVNLEHGTAISNWNRLRNFWEFGGWAMHRFESRDDLDTRGGPLIVAPAFSEGEVWFETDSRKPVFGWAFMNLGGSAKGSSWHNIGGGITVRPASRVEIQLQPRLSWNTADAQWVENVNDDGDDTDDHFVYARLKSRTLDLTTRINVLFSRDLSLELYVQPFASAGDYSNYRELAHPSSYEFSPWSQPEDNPDFRTRSYQSNLVLRWEYRPGSTLFLVWSQSRSRDFEHFRFRPLGDALGSLSDDGTDILLMKLNYWMSM
jgi:hypothetical protein